MSKIGEGVFEWAGRPYEVLTVCNGDFFFFLKGLLNSLSLNCSPNTVNVGDMGLTYEQAEWVKRLPHNSSPPVELFETSGKTRYRGDWSQDWVRTVSEKTHQARRILEEKGRDMRLECPLVMMDSDCVAVKDFKDLIDHSKDVQVCSRHGRISSVPYLGSFVVFNDIGKGLYFLDTWMENMRARKERNPNRACESPALGDTVHQLKLEVTVGEIEEHLVSGYSKKDLDNGSYILHFKSEGLTKTVREAYRSRVVSRGLEAVFKKYSQEPS